MTISWFSNLIRAEIHSTLIPRRRLLLISLVVHLLHTTFSEQHALGVEGVLAAVDFVFRDGKADAVLILCRHPLRLLVAELLSEAEEILLFASLTRRILLTHLSELKLI